VDLTTTSVSTATPPLQPSKVFQDETFITSSGRIFGTLGTLQGLHLRAWTGSHRRRLSDKRELKNIKNGTQEEGTR